MSVEQLPLVICEELAWSCHVWQEEVCVDAVEGHRLVDHVSTVIACSVDTSNAIVLLKVSSKWKKLITNKKYH